MDCQTISEAQSVTPQSPQAPSDSDDALDDLSDEDIMSRFISGKRLSSDDHPFSENSTVHITNITIGKPAQDIDEDVPEPAEAVALTIVAQHTTIPVPRVHRVVTYPDDARLIVMNYVPGRQLSVVWPEMSLSEKERVVETLRGHVRQLRAVDIPRREIPGPLSEDDTAWVCEASPVFGQVVSYHGPFPSYAALEAFFNDRRGRAQAIVNRQRSKDGESPIAIPDFDASYLVLKHQDINPT